jgi:hypothetical protein
MSVSLLKYLDGDWEHVRENLRTDLEQIELAFNQLKSIAITSNTTVLSQNITNTITNIVGASMGTPKVIPIPNDGEDGQDGMPGQMGPIGPQGLQGFAGPQGDPGEDGDAFNGGIPFVPNIQNLTTAPAAPFTSIQFNNSGVFGGSASLEWDGTDLLVPSLVLGASPSTSTIGVIFRGAATAADRFIHDYSKVGDPGQSSNLFIGLGAGNFTLASTGGNNLADNNIGIGKNALAVLTSGATNTVIGANGAGGSLTTGFKNVFIGDNAGSLQATGSTNMAIGSDALRDNVSGSGNVAMGFGALKTCSVSFLTAVGNGALGGPTLSGAHNTAVGSTALAACSTGDSNVAVGDGALASSTGGRCNTAVGSSALNLLTGGFNVGIGQGAGETCTTDTNNVFVGFSADRSGGSAISGSIALGYNVFVGASNTCVIGTSSLVETKLFGNLTIAKLVTTYDGIATKGWGHPTVYGLDNRTGLVAADGAAITLYTTIASNNIFRVSADIFATAAVTGTATYTIAWTENGTGQTMSVTATAVNTLGTASNLIRPDTGTTITAQLTGVFTGTFTVVGLVEQVA